MEKQAELIASVLSAPDDRRDAILRAAKGEERVRMGTVNEAARILGTCNRTVERYAAQGAFPRVHLSPRRVRYDLCAVERFSHNGHTLA